MTRMTEFKGYKIPPKGLMCASGGGGNECGNKIFCHECLFAGVNNELDYIEWLKYHDLTKIETPFGLLPRWVKENLKKAYNGKDGRESNIQFFASSSDWDNLEPGWYAGNTYRLDPNWKPEPETVKVSKEEVFKVLKEKYGKNVEIVE